MKKRPAERPFKQKDKTKREDISREGLRDRSDERHRRRERSDTGTFIYGISPVAERLRTRPGSVATIFALGGSSEHRLREIAGLARQHGVVIERVDRQSLDRIAGPAINHQGIIAIAAAADYTEAETMIARADKDTLFVILDGIEDPRNFGAILRSAECAGAQGVFIPERRAAGLTETVAKSSAGAIEHIPVARVQNLNRLIEELKERDIWVIGTSGHAELSYTEWDWTRPSALVLGNEGAGLHRLVAANCDVLVKIPMYGKIDSLNVSVAAGVVLFEARRQREAASKV